MNTQNGSATEVQIRKCESHIQRLRIVVSCVAAQAGMNRKEIEEAQNAVSEVCLRAMTPTPKDPDGQLSIRLWAQSGCLSVEITDKSPNCERLYVGELASERERTEIAERVGTLADKVELIRNGDSITIVLTKYAGQAQPTRTTPAHYVPALGVTTLQN